jgi:hypothetical protein
LLRAVVELIADVVSIVVLPVFAGVADAVVVGVGLREIRDARTVVAGVPNAISIEISLFGIGNAGTDVPLIDDAVVVSIPLGR